MTRSIVLLTAVFYVLALSACTHLRPAEFTKDSIMLPGARHAYAVYNDQLRLLTDPIPELYQETSAPLPLASDPNAKAAVSDVYIVAHGWNFTLPEAYVNFHNYLELLDRHLAELQRVNPDFQPYIVFVLWPSVTRPLTESAQALLPFGLDRALRPLTVTLDETVIHLPSAWAESLNALSLALGTHTHGFYGKYPPDCGPLDQRDDKYGVDTSGTMGRDCPVWALVHSVLKWRNQPKHQNVKIHLIGHSYGAKVVTLAAMEALHSHNNDEGESTGLGPIESLVLLNPAFHPREVESKTGAPETFPQISILKGIPRKAVIYSAKDFATGRWFDVSQMVFANDAGHRYFAESLDLPDRCEEAKKRIGRDDSTQTCDVIGPLLNAPIGGLSVAGTVVGGVLSWSLNKAVDMIFFDPWYHVQQRSFYRWLRSTSPNPSCFDGIRDVTRCTLNFVDFFVPVGRIALSFAGSSEYSGGDQMGILRAPYPALGNTGLDRLYAGRKSRKLPEEMADFVDFDLHRTDRRNRLVTDIQFPQEDGRSGRYGFCTLALKPVGAIPGGVSREFIYSYDATDILDGINLLSGGAHGDVRSTDPPKSPPSYCVASNSKGAPLERREYVFQFLYNFTKASTH